MRERLPVSADDLPDPPSDEALEFGRQALTPLYALHRPVLHGAEHIPDEGPALLIGNHGLFGVIDAPLMVLEIYRETGRKIRALGDNAHFKVPGWGDLLESMGVVPGTQENGQGLLAGDQIVLIFPGGAREVYKRRGESYELKWKERTGFLRMAATAGVPIIPFGAVGADETFDVVLDIDSKLATPLKAAAKAVGFKLDYAVPLAKGIGPTILPRNQQFHFVIGEPIDVSDLADHTDDHDVLMDRRDAIQRTVEGLIDEAQVLREAD
jgi:1-acyl-sn-glycerol-3-phosphate acyltransferase